MLNYVAYFIDIFTYAWERLILKDKKISLDY